VPSIFFTDPTPANGATLTQNYAYINTTALSSRTAFIDWNRSLVGWWRFNNESGESRTFFRDWSSWGNNGTCSGASCPNSTSGKFGNGSSFDGINDYITMGNPSNGALDFGTGDFSISSWFYMSSLPNAWKTIVSKGDSGAVGYGMEISSGNQLTCSIQASSGTSQHLGSSVPTAGSWHQGVCVFNRSDKIYAYLDGIQVASGTYAANNTNSVTSYKAYAQDAAGNVNQTETRTLTLISAPVPGGPSITGYAPPSPVIDTPGATRQFNITVNQTVNVTWYINGTQVQFNNSVTDAKYTNTSASIGVWNVSEQCKRHSQSEMGSECVNTASYNI
ncbi:MAG: LamG domain-containing protein, partial [Candidatus Methanoperedens sp.]|nr:LamG domain-containing protein [Candidatus Methanoperedens sp.]